jgi:hypothetical protein
MKPFTLMLLSLLCTTTAHAQIDLDRQPSIPPPEFDKGPPDKYVEIRPDQNMLEVLCPRTGWPVNGGLVGCTYLERTTGKCWVLIAPDDVIAKTGLTVAEFRRHEQGHCHLVNGVQWSNKHEGGRNLQGIEVIPRSMEQRNSTSGQAAPEAAAPPMEK